MDAIVSGSANVAILVDGESLWSLRRTGAGIEHVNEIIDYLATIDEKLDDVLRAAEDAVLADLIGAGFDIDEAMTIREHAGRVNEVTWSKVQATSATIARSATGAHAMSASVNASVVSPACSRTVTPARSAIWGPWFLSLSARITTTSCS